MMMLLLFLFIFHLSWLQWKKHTQFLPLKLLSEMQADMFTNYRFMFVKSYLFWKIIVNYQQQNYYYNCNTYINIQYTFYMHNLINCLYIHIYTYTYIQILMIMIIIILMIIYNVQITIYIYIYSNIYMHIVICTIHIHISLTLTHIHIDSK